MVWYARGCGARRQDPLQDRMCKAPQVADKVFTAAVQHETRMLSAQSDNISESEAIRFQVLAMLKGRSAWNLGHASEDFRVTRV
jgi:hypothetical protein